MSSLNGKYFLNTRPRNQGRELSLLLGKEGARTLEFPTVDITGPTEIAKIKETLVNLPKGSWLLFTSSNAIRGLASLISDISISELQGKPNAHVVNLMERFCHELRIAVVGRSSAEVAREYGLSLEFVSAEPSAEGFAESFAAQYAPGLKRSQMPVVFLRGSVYNDALPTMLLAEGINLSEIEIYSAQMFHPGNEALRKLRYSLTCEDRTQALGGIVLTSGNCGRNLVALLKQHSEHELIEKLKRVPAFAIGDKTKEAGEELGLNVVRVSKSTNVRGLVRSIICHFSSASAPLAEAAEDQVSL